MFFYQVLRGAGNSAQTADVSSVTYFAPIVSFLIVFMVIFLLLRKTKVLGENNPFIDVFVSLLVAVVFVTAASVRQVVLNVVPWFAVLIMALFFILLIAGFIGKTDMIGKGVGWGFVVLLIIIFLVAGIKVFAGTLGAYIPGPYYGSGGDQELYYFFDWFYSPRVIGAFLLVVAAVVTSFILVKFSK